MRVLLTAQMDTEKANQAITDNTLPKTMSSLLEQVKPESVFFGAKDGVRTVFIVFDLKEPSDMPSVAEPLFQELGAKVTVMPVMNFDEVRAGLQKYGSS
ncbi:hypothetical protein OG946_25050 [Streptomyces sp. NBC_01808]|uniref:hypothetical protein n=1 Tax=Streptomyces sp. NBC_01808 TaxID=2975947 RepID=UPI002DD94535|nr:hypothetical protein [Streptomyces sp. NBC_01808]WSA40347.1 hypothetical protein OG946_25050 [Streptomyces sp. NBC_01808]